MRHHFLIFFGLALVACSPGPYRESFTAVVYDVPSKMTISPNVDFSHSDPHSGESVAKLLESHTFWRMYVVPQLSVDLAHDDLIKSGLKISARPDQIVDGKRLATFDVSLRHGGETVFRAIIKGYDSYAESLLQDRLKYAKDVRDAADRFGNKSESLRISREIEILERQMRTLRPNS